MFQLHTGFIWPVKVSNHRGLGAKVENFNGHPVFPPELRFFIRSQ